MNRPTDAVAVDVLAVIASAAVDFVNNRAIRMEARRARNKAAGDFKDEGEPDDCYDPESDHPMGYSAAFIEATRETQAAYVAALSAEKSARQRLYAAVRKFNARATNGAQT